jgi:CRISPR-associated protein Cmr2
MTVDYFAEFGGRTGQPDLQKIDEITIRYHILVATGHKTEADALREQWGKLVRPVLPIPDSALWQPIAHPIHNLAILPFCSFSLHFKFTLAQPYMSKDDNALYIIDNSIVRDKVFGLPMVRPSRATCAPRCGNWSIARRRTTLSSGSWVRFAGTNRARRGG